MEISDMLTKIIDILTTANAQEGLEGKYAKGIAELVSTRNTAENYLQQRAELLAEINKKEEQKLDLTTGYAQQLNNRNAMKARLNEERRQMNITPTMTDEEQQIRMLMAQGTAKF